MKNKKIILGIFSGIIFFSLFIFFQKINAQNNQTDLIGEFSATPSGEGFLLKWSAPQANFCFPLGEMWTNKFTSSGQQMVYPQYPTTYSLFCYNNRTKIYQTKEVTITDKDLTPKIDLVAIPEKVNGLGDTVFLMLYILRKGDIKYCSAIDFYKYWQTKVGAQQFLQYQKVDIEKNGIFALVRPDRITDYVIECYNSNGELRARDIARVTPNYSKYQEGLMQAIRNGDNVVLTWQIPSTRATYCLLARGSDVNNYYLVNTSGSLTLPLKADQMISLLLIVLTLIII
ncbi:MAG: hypothetical protein ACPLXL_02010 [Minisyncoccia bacterium]